MKIIKDLGVISVAKTDKRRCAIFLCDCGTQFTTQTRYVKSEKVKNCPTCSRSNAQKTHGLSKHPIYKSYIDMKRRCLSKTSEKYEDYGGRGITICEEWLKDFLTFYNWSIKNGWAINLTIDRKNVDSNYTTTNCRWIDKRSQAHNKRQYKNNTTGYGGVTRKGDKFLARAATWDKKRITLGTFQTAEEAAKTRDAYYVVNGFVEMRLNNVDLFNNILKD